MAAALVRVRVDRDTGETQILEYVAAQDCGRAINPALVEGQMRGGAAQSVGIALYEDLAHDDAGQLVAGTFMSYALPREAECAAQNGLTWARGRTHPFRQPIGW